MASVIRPLLFNNLFKLPNLRTCFRTSFTSNFKSSYVQNVRKQQDILRRHEICSSDYRDGKFLILDCAQSSVLVNQNENVNTLLWNRYEDIQNLGFDVEQESVFLSHTNGTPKFTLNIAPLSKENKLILESKTSGKFISLRASLFSLHGEDTSLVSQSHSLLLWNMKNKFCVYCGGSLKSDLYGTQKRCTSCKVTHYPTISPVGITLVSNLSQSHVLLVRQHIHPPRMFTCIAGFIETGESIEENIQREIAEEVALEVHDIQYIASQHWSLLGSRLMIGCWATVHDEDFQIDSDELEEAGWFTPQQLKSALKTVYSKKEDLLTSQQIWVPPPGAIAHNLIKTWLQKYH